MKVLVTGSAGFIGYHLIQRLIREGISCISLDSVNSYYDVRLKEARLQNLSQLSKDHRFYRMDLTDLPAMTKMFQEEKPTHVIHLAAQAGVRYSIDHPEVYIQSNLVGFFNIMQLAKEHQVKHFVYASTSSVYGANKILPFKEDQHCTHPLTLYAATKMSNENMAHSYSTIFGMPTTGLRFFTVYGPWGRPDMALFKFTERILRGDEIEVYNFGKHTRDFTFGEDIVDGIFRIFQKPAASGTTASEGSLLPCDIGAGPSRVFNIGGGRPEPLNKMIKILEESLGKSAKVKHLPLQVGDVVDTAADCGSLKAACGYEAKTPIEVGIPRFVDWYRSYFSIR
jgi:UDP-glucuronate 4-epimerase